MMDPITIVGGLGALIAGGFWKVATGGGEGQTGLSKLEEELMTEKEIEERKRQRRGEK
jgi:hypothetical protein